MFHYLDPMTVPEHRVLILQDLGNTVTLIAMNEKDDTMLPDEVWKKKSTEEDWGRFFERVKAKVKDYILDRADMM